MVTLLLVAKDAHAYLDPNTGSIILQAVIAFLASSTVLVLSYWQKIKGYFGRGQSKDKAADKPEPAASERSTRE
ncbi:MAG: hypothetical protein E4H11_05510 [Myxococcales bacterium]|nr:MAG: hypothetical protein E4H11_05510 [Myxococcales bacterium]